MDSVELNRQLPGLTWPGTVEKLRRIWARSIGRFLPGTRPDSALPAPVRTRGGRL